MRDIIFRAWYNNKELLEVDTIFFRDGKPFVYLKRGKEVFGQGKCDVVLEQYTGLKDKNGKMIFEGDVVFAGYGEYYQGIHEHSTTIIIDMSNDDALNALCYANVVEVIGNIHDQKEDV